MAKIGRNTLCPCGSGLKYKKCCLQASEEAVAEPRTPRPCHWFLDEVSSMDTQEIIALLHRFGIPFEKEQFFKDVDKHYSCSDLTKTWKKGDRRNGDRRIMIDNQYELISNWERAQKFEPLERIPGADQDD
jgi:hypothetical protein